MRFLLKCVLGIFFISTSIHCFADASLLRKPQVQYFINDMVKTEGFDRGQLITLLKDAQFQPQIIESMEKPYEKKTWDVYRAIFLTQQRLQGGLDYWKKNQQTLALAEKKYGVPAPVIVAILGVETLYGEKQGQYRVLDALTTLAFSYPKRSPFFTKELKEYLLLCREQKVPATHYIGSYAGAIGKPQFMPSSYRFFAVDFAGNGKRDLVSDDKDVIGSVANYFQHHGWQKNQEVAHQALVVGDNYKKLQANTRNANYNLNHLLAAGVKPLSNLPTPHPHQAGIIELSLDKGEEYWLAFPNFYVITRYNTSPQYALVVYLLSQQLQQEWNKQHAPHKA